jgi:hypothetical protein
VPSTAPDQDTFKRFPKSTRRGLNWTKLTGLQQNWHSDWRLGLLIGCAASGLVLIINITILLFGVFRYGGFQNGIGTLAQGQSASISHFSTAYHVLINTASTILLTSSNYCMQVLCSPTREEVDQAHRQIQWLNLGVSSPHNLRFVSVRRIFLFWTLGLSSVPLHLLYVDRKTYPDILPLTSYSYNSALFEVTMGQDYYVDFVPASNDTLIDSLFSRTTNMTNREWKKIYDTQFVPNAGNVHLVVDEISYGIVYNMNFTWDYAKPNATAMTNDWSVLNPGEEPGAVANVMLGPNGTFDVSWPQSRRLVKKVSTYELHKSLPRIKWPESILVKPSLTKSILSVPSLSGINETSGWLAKEPLHIAYALVEPISNSSSVQIGLFFMIIVIASNVAKFVAILLTLRDPLSSRLVTTGDAIASFLARPDLATVGMCNLESQEIIKQLRRPQNVQSAPKWRGRRLFILAAIGRNEITIFSIIM